MTVCNAISHGRWSIILASPESPETSPVALGLVGVGRWGRRYVHTIAALPSVRIAVAVSRNPETATLLPDIPILSQWTALFDHALDGIVIATPPSTHGAILRACLEAGIPALVKKPLCLDLAEAETLRALAAARDVPVLVDHTQLFHPAFPALQEHLSGLGPIRSITSEGMALGP